MLCEAQVHGGVATGVKWKKALYEFKKNKFNYFVVAALRAWVGTATKSSSNNVVIADIVTKYSFKSLKEKWHVKLGHPSDRVLCQVLQLCKIKFNGNEKFFCESCLFGENHALPFTLSTSRAKTVLELIHTNVWGPSPV